MDTQEYLYHLEGIFNNQKRALLYAYNRDGRGGKYLNVLSRILTTAKVAWDSGDRVLALKALWVCSCGRADNDILMMQSLNDFSLIDPFLENLTDENITLGKIVSALHSLSRSLSDYSKLFEFDHELMSKFYHLFVDGTLNDVQFDTAVKLTVSVNSFLYKGARYRTFLEHNVALKLNLARFLLHMIEESPDGNDLASQAFSRENPRSVLFLIFSKLSPMETTLFKEFVENTFNTEQELYTSIGSIYQLLRARDTKPNAVFKVIGSSAVIRLVEETIGVAHIDKPAISSLMDKLIEHDDPLAYLKESLTTNKETLLEFVDGNNKPLWELWEAVI